MEVRVWEKKRTSYKWFIILAYSTSFISEKGPFRSARSETVWPVRVHLLDDRIEIVVLSSKCHGDKQVSVEFGLGGYMQAYDRIFWEWLIGREICLNNSSTIAHKLQRWSKSFGQTNQPRNIINNSSPAKRITTLLNANWFDTCE